ncbi:MAG: adenylosuccinate synthase [Bacteriovoracaceae bacterium]|jgi:adenylosuccinate synthase|nr:adenylosuccinate synthase [Bacteriovoracaceae bacterium]
MKSLAIIGAQWGDEGKGKISDYFGQKADLVVRFQGGNNAGHTIIVGDVKTILHVIPSGVLHKNCLSIIGHGVVFDPEAFLVELEEVRAATEITGDNLKISLGAAVITSYHKIIDGIREEGSGTKIGTTKKGIGPCYEDKISRRGIKIKDLFDLENLEARLEEQIMEKKFLFDNLYKCEYPSCKEEAKKLFELGKILKPFVADTFGLIDDAVKAGRKILFEGAQGVLLDIDYGSYPFVTSSNTSSGGVYTGAGLPGKQLDESVGIVKAYTTRVGTGPFPTEQLNDMGELIQTKGHEFGATTGRRRRCGWLDLPLLKYSAKVSNLTSLAVTKLDILSGLDELKVCVGYEYEGEIYETAFPGLDLEKVKPVYRDMTPFNDTFENGELSTELGEYIDIIEEFVGVPVGILAYGPERSQISFRKEYF